MTDNPPAGWYPDTEGAMRWWDGSAWVEIADSPQAAGALLLAPAVEEPHPARDGPGAHRAHTATRRSWFKKRR